MDSGPAVSHHEQELALRKKLSQVSSGLEGERVFVAEPPRGLSVSGHNLKNESG